MTKRHLWLIRHAKAAAHGGNDHERELSRRGYRQCVEMGGFLASVKPVPEVFFSSTATRAKTTAHILSAFVGGTVLLDEDLYTFDTEVLLQALLLQLQQWDLNEVRSVAVVAHNHAISDLVAELTYDSTTITLPTLGLAELVFEADWADMVNNRCTLVQSQSPQAKKHA